jgi:hypothetical protein
MRATAIAGMAVSLTCVAFGQSASTAVHFEVVSIKPAPLPVDGGYRVRMRSDPARLDNRFSLRAIIQRACEVQDFQISGPDWLASTRFDIVAKLPDESRSGPTEPGPNTPPDGAAGSAARPGSKVSTTSTWVVDHVEKTPTAN